MSEAARLAGVFFSPGKAFADIARRPRWWIPVILIAILSTIYLNAFTQRVGWESVIRPAIERTPNGQNMTAQQREQAIRTAAGSISTSATGAPRLERCSTFSSLR